jgi:predicted alpha/beta superfamily hydrolase
MKPLFLFLAIAFTSFYVKAQHPAVTIPGTEVRKITSAIVTGQEYELHILLPGSHKNSNKKYPVVYLMDSQWDFPLVKSIYGQQYYDGFIPELIIVGITWGGAKPDADSLRARDYTPTNETRQIQSGGADKFLQFMKDELFPFIESNYKADKDNRTLMGCSLGGLVTLYAMFTHTEMFTGYAAASPAIGWDREVIYKHEKKFDATKIVNPIRLYLTVGDVERNSAEFVKFSNYISSKKYANVTIRSKVLENTGHSGTKSETYNRGLQFIFEKPAIKVDDAVLKNYTGKYEGAKGNIVELKAENNKLMLYYPAGNSYH